MFMYMCMYMYTWRQRSHTGTDVIISHNTVETKGPMEMKNEIEVLNKTK